MKHSLQNLPYKEEGLLGKGSFAEVYKVTMDGKTYALKKFLSYQLANQAYYESALREIEIMKKLDHPNILKFYNVYMTGENESM